MISKNGDIYFEHLQGSNIAHVFFDPLFELAFCGWFDFALNAEFA
jgi:hypothetical protein